MRIQNCSLCDAFRKLSFGSIQKEGEEVGEDKSKHTLE